MKRSSPTCENPRNVHEGCYTGLFRVDVFAKWLRG